MVNKKNEIHVVDMFCGGGGESTGYRFTGTKAEVVKQIGNAVPPVFAEKLFTSYVGKENVKRSF